MSYSTFEIGKTGPAGRIGAGTEYHIDTKFSDTLSWEGIRDRFDTLAGKYKGVGRNIEFSNQGVGGLVYDLNASPEERLSLLRRAAGAHAPRSGWHSFDYFAPNIGTDRYDSSAEGAPIFVVGQSGRKSEGGTGGNYGNYAVVLDENGNVVSKSGHGDESGSVFGGGVFGGADAQPVEVNSDNPSQTTPQQEAVERVQQYKANTAKDVVDNFGNDFGSMKSQGLAKALAGAQESIIQKRMDGGEMFGGRMVEVEKPKKDDESGK